MTGDFEVTYFYGMSTGSGQYDAAVTIAAIADPSRRLILDLLRAKDGQAVRAYEEALPHLGRHAVLKHVSVLERAGLLLTRKVGRQRFCYLNPVPLLDLARQWTTDYSAAWGHQLIDLRNHTETLERNSTMTDQAPDFVQQVVIHAPIQRVWDAITTTDAHRWYFGARLSTTEQGADYTIDDTDDRTHIRGTNLEVDPPRLLVQTFDARWDEGVRADAPSHVTWRLEERGPLTFVTVEHRGVAGTETGRQSARGWPCLLSSLKTYLETGSPLPLPAGMAG
ncbi:hypothetical protein B0293_33205 [Amycolatopsis azurea DSM 43854]|uniref:HTH arsR-type domain-containing protein n=2 Tax=Amycolatopsis azurea TaxID=36819 RepID=A0ABX3J3N3_9PSEU|nr:hypothetical protein B0293_33205 [Amycolatopsis azurea DSM 43854]